MKVLRIMVAVIAAALILGIGLLYAWHCGWIVTDRSAETHGIYIDWNERRYVLCSAVAYDEERTIARTTDGHTAIRELKEDPSHTFIVARMGTDDACYVAEDYTIPTEGTITAVSWNDTYITDPAFLKAVQTILATKEPTFVHETNGIYQLTDGQRMRRLEVAYEGCPIAACHKGYMGQIDGKWAITILEPIGTENLLEIYTIPDEYADVLSTYFE